MVATPTAFICILLTKVTKYTFVVDVVGLFPFETGNLVRYYFYRRTLASCGKDVNINFGAVIRERGTTIGNDVRIGRYSTLALVVIRDHVTMESGCCIISGAKEHSFDRTDVPIMNQPYHREQVCVGSDVWLGAHALVMANVGNRCVIGAGCVVARPIPAGTVCIGYPARIIQRRDQVQTTR
jgi:acetyltransferase-like isoleucine patch superfamily enzyme